MDEITTEYITINPNNTEKPNYEKKPKIKIYFKI